MREQVVFAYGLAAGYFVESEVEDLVLFIEQEFKTFRLILTRHGLSNMQRIDEGLFYRLFAGNATSRESHV